MKKLGKALLVTLVLSLILGIAGICTFAIGEEKLGSTPRTEKAALSEHFDFIHTHASGSSTYHTESEFATQVNKMTSGDTITLIDNIEIHGETLTPGGLNGSFRGDLNNRKQIHINLNGYRLSSVGTSADSVLFSYYTANSASVYDNPESGNQQRYIDLYLYSSDTTHTAQIFAASKTVDTVSGTYVMGSQRLFDVCSHYVNVYVGDVTNKPVIEYTASYSATTGSVSHTTASCDGDNIETYSGAFLLSTDGGTTASNPRGSSVNVGGGKHYQTDSKNTMIKIATGTDFTATGATFVAIGDNAIFTTSYSDTLERNPVKNSEGVLQSYGDLAAPSDTNVVFDDCFLYTEGTVLLEAHESRAIENFSVKNSEILFKDCDIAGSKIHDLDTTVGTPEFRNCNFANADYNDTINEIIRNNTSATVELPLVNFKGSNVTDTTDENCYSLDPSTYDIAKTTKTIVYVATSAPSGTYTTVDISWKLPNVTVTEKWFIGNIVPTPPISLQNNHSDFYTLKFPLASDIKTTEVSGDVTYTVEEIIKFTIKANITLYSDFVYNLYIPRGAGDSEAFNFVRIDKITNTGIAKGSSFALNGNDDIELKDLENLGEHYVVTQKISACFGDEQYRLVVCYDGYAGASEYTINFSIPNYVEIVNNGNYSSTAKAMVTSALEYIKASSNYYAKKYDQTIKYTGENAPQINGTASAIQAAAPPYAIKEVFHGATLNISDKINFRFYLFNDFEGDVKFTYSFNTWPKTVTISREDIKNNTCTADDGTRVLYFDIELKAIDLRSAIGIELENGVKYSYSLANYVYSTKSVNDNYLTELVNALWIYSVNAKKYFNDTESDSPAVNISVNGAPITSEDYEIVINSEKEAPAAKTIQDEILAKTGEMLEIVYESTGKSAIRISILDKPDKKFDFEVYVDGYDLVISSSFASFIDEAVLSFTEEYIKSRVSGYNFADTFKENYFTDKIYYSDFGANGIDMSKIPAEYKNVSTWYGNKWEETVRPTLVNDFFAMRETHLFANETKRYTVYADEGATYYISETWDNSLGSVVKIPIMTNVVWGDAVIVIDDSNLPGYSLSASDIDEEKYTALRTKYWNDIPGITVNEKIAEWSKLAKQGSSHVFSVSSEHSMSTISDPSILSSLAGIDSTTTKIDLGLDYPAMLVVYNSSHKVYRRRGYSTNWQGSTQHELVVIDENGNIDPETKLQFSYTTVSKIEIYRLDSDPITVDGGTAVTLASRVDTYLYDKKKEQPTIVPVVKDGNISRGISVTRPNTTVSNLEHVIVGEITIDEYVNKQMIGPAYSGFFTANNTSDVTFKDCILQGRRCYSKSPIYNMMGVPEEKQSNGGTSGTYDLTAERVNRLKFDGCIQSNFFVELDSGYNITFVPESEIGSDYTMSMDSAKVYNSELNNSVSFQMHWGCGGTNFCKNMSYVNSTISRFDAHCGLYNGAIIGSSVNAIALVGAGTMLVEDTTYYSTGGSGNALVSPRSDYGSTWNGEIILRDITVRENQTKAEVQDFVNKGESHEVTFTSIVYHSYNNWYYGYESVFPSITIDNIDYLYKDGITITPEERGPVSFAIQNVKSENKNVVFYSFVQEPNLNLPRTTEEFRAVISNSGYISGFKPASYAYVDANGDGWVDFTVVDENEDGEADFITKGTKIDTNDDGLADAIDTNGDGILDAVRICNVLLSNNTVTGVDVTGDGTADKVTFKDEDKDGAIDASYGVDTDNDGIIDFIYGTAVDANKDGVPEGIDTTGDGRIDYAEYKILYLAVPYYSDSAKPANGFKIDYSNGFIAGIKDAPYFSELSEALRYKNINPVKPPEKITVYLYGDNDYDFTSIIERYQKDYVSSDPTTSDALFARWAENGSKHYDNVDVTFFDNTVLEIIRLPEGAENPDDPGTPPVNPDEPVDPPLEDPWSTPPTEGIKYTLNSDGVSYSVSGIGTSEDSVIIIASTYNGLPVTAISSSAFEGNNNITAIYIPQGIREIGSFAFQNCKNLKNVVFHDECRIRTIEHMAFYNCDALESITISMSVKTIQYRAFYGCDNLTIYCEADEAPATWDEGWNDYNCAVVWNSDNKDDSEYSYECEVHSIVYCEAKAPTCTEIGWHAYEYCLDCDAYTTYVEIAALGHDIINHNEKEPTCTETGWHAYESCSRCNYSTKETIAALGHTEGEIVVENNVAPGCATTGSYDNVVYCTVCGEELSRTTVTISALGHTEGEIVVENNVAPGCVTTGSYDNVVYCTVCGEELSRTTVTVSALGHTEVTDSAKAPTCTETGLTEGKHCSVCGETLVAQKVVDAHGHDFTHYEGKEPTQTEIGWKDYDVCNTCGHTTYVELPKLPKEEDAPLIGF